MPNYIPHILTNKLLSFTNNSPFIFSCETRVHFHLFNHQTFNAMKTGSYFINISRGETVDEAALLENLINGKLAFAGLDVFKHEPLTFDSPFWDLPNVLITPHRAGDISDYLSRAMAMFSDVFSDFIQGKEIRNRVDLDLRY